MGSSCVECLDELDEYDEDHICLGCGEPLCDECAKVFDFCSECRKREEQKGGAYDKARL